MNYFHVRSREDVLFTCARHRDDLIVVSHAWTTNAIASETNAPATHIGRTQIGVMQSNKIHGHSCICCGVWMRSKNANKYINETGGKSLKLTNVMQSVLHMQKRPIGPQINGYKYLRPCCHEKNLRILSDHTVGSSLRLLFNGAIEAVIIEQQVIGPRTMSRCQWFDWTFVAHCCRSDLRR